MAWTASTRGGYVRASGTYASDVTDREWALIASLLPAAKRGGRPRSTCLRQVVNAVFYLLQTGCQWRMLPRDFPPRSTVYGYFRAWIAAGVWAHVHDVLYRQSRELEGRDESPTAAIIDSQSVRTGAEAREMVGFDAGKRVKGRKRHLVTDTLGLMLRIEVHSASIQDRDGAALVLDRITRRFPFIERFFADAGYQGPRVAEAAPRPVEIIKRTYTGFVVQPKRWVIERTFLGVHQPPHRLRRRARRSHRSRPLTDRDDQAHVPQDRTLQSESDSKIANIPRHCAASEKQT
jgi:transposase